MSSSKLIVVVGVTGNQGSSVAKTFSKLSGWRVRGISRRPNDASTQHLKDLGIELVPGDLDQIQTLIDAFSGADAIFGVTDFWQFTSDPKLQEKAKTSGTKLNVLCMEREIEQFKNIIDAAAEVLMREKKLERLVMSTLSDTKKWSNGRITENLHFDGKAAGIEYLKSSAKAELVALAKITSCVQIGWYLDNWRSPLGWSRPILQDDGTFLYYSTGVPPYEKDLPTVHPPTDTGPFVKALVVDNPAGLTMLGTSQMMKYPAYVKLLEEKLGRPVKLVATTREQAIAKMGETFGGEIAASGDYVSTIGWTGGDPEVKLPWECGVDMSQVTTAEQYVQQTDWSEVFHKR